MKKLLLTIASAALMVTAVAQNPTTYFMEGSTLRSQWNPAFAPYRGYVNIPVIGGIQVGTEGNISLSSIVIPHDGKLTTIFDGSVSRSIALDKLNPENYLGVDTRMNILGFGAYTKNGKSFWSFDLGLRLAADVNLPYSLFEFMKTGNSTTIEELQARAEAYAEAAFAWSWQVKPKWHLGIRGKVLLGVGRLNANIENADIHMAGDMWKMSALGNVSVSGLQLGQDGSTYTFNDISFGGLGGFGVGVDVGVTYDVLPQLQLSASVTDLGAMFWFKNKTQVASMEESIMFDGVKIDEHGAKQPHFDLEDFELNAEENKGETNMLRTAINIGGEYSFLQRRISLGLFYSVKFWETKVRHNLVFAANFRPLYWLHVSGSLSLIDNRGTAVGLALNFCPNKGINFFVGTDVLLSKVTPQFIPVNQSRMNVTFGIGVPIGKVGTRYPKVGKKQ